MTYMYMGIAPNGHVHSVLALIPMFRPLMIMMMMMMMIMIMITVAALLKPAHHSHSQISN